MNMKKLLMNVSAVLLVMNMPLVSALPFSLPKIFLTHVCARSIQAAKENPTYATAALLSASALVCGSVYVWYKIQNMSLGGFYSSSFALDHNIPINLKIIGHDQEIKTLPESVIPEEQQQEEITDVSEEYIQEVSDVEEDKNFDGHGSYMDASREGAVEKEPEEVICNTGINLTSIKGTDYQSFSGSEIDISNEDKKTNFKQEDKEEIDAASIASASTNTPFNEKGSNDPAEDEKDGYVEKIKRASAVLVSKVRSLNQLSTLMHRFNSQPGAQKNEELMEQIIAEKETVENYDSGSESYFTAREEEEAVDPGVIKKLENMTKDTAILEVKDLMTYIMNIRLPMYYGGYSSGPYAGWIDRFWRSKSPEDVLKSITVDIHDKMNTVKAIILFAENNSQKNEDYYKRALDAQEGLSTMPEEVRTVYEKELDRRRQN